MEPSGMCRSRVGRVPLALRVAVLAGGACALALCAFLTLQRVGCFSQGMFCPLFGRNTGTLRYLVDSGGELLLRDERLNLAVYIHEPRGGRGFALEQTPEGCTVRLASGASIPILRQRNRLIVCIVPDAQWSIPMEPGVPCPLAKCVSLQPEEDFARFLCDHVQAEYAEQLRCLLRCDSLAHEDPDR
jgi:hypothetical protein